MSVSLDEKAAPTHGLDSYQRVADSSTAAQIDTEKKAFKATKQQADTTLVSFTKLFECSTKYELFLDFIGLIAAVAAGAAQPLMSLPFGRLTQDFVTFGQITQNVDTNNATAQALVHQAAANFRNATSKNASYLVYIGVGSVVLTYIYMHVWVYTGEVGAKRLREKYLQAVLRQDISFFDSVGAGETATRIQTDTHLVQQGTSEKVAIVVSYLSAFITGFVLAYTKSWRLALAMTSIIPCIFITGALATSLGATYTRLSLEHVAQGGTLAEEVISSVRTVQAFGTQKTHSALFYSHIARSRRANFKLSVVQGCSMGFFYFCFLASYGLAFSFGTTLINSGHADAGIVVNVFFAIIIGTTSLTLLATELPAITNALGAATKLYAVIDRIPVIDSADRGGLQPSKVVGEIALEDVKFSYPSRPTIPILQGVTVAFQAGKSTALVGASGSGKSTIISLVERFYDPTAGSVKLDGVDLKDLNLKWTRSQIGLVSQEPVLFATTIKENVAHGLINTPYEHASEKDKFELIKQACINSNADGFISKLPHGYDTLVGERGFLLSGGQKQRIAIARAIVSDPRILLLDEATSALDTQSEAIVQDALNKAAAGRTTITIAHRLSTIKDADMIYVMGDGFLLEHGIHDDLMARRGAYAKLVQMQRLHEDQQASRVGAVKAEEREGLKKATEDDELPRRLRPDTATSLTSQILAQRGQTPGGKEGDYSLAYLSKRMWLINPEGRKSYIMGFMAAAVVGTLHPAVGFVFAKGVGAFSELDPHNRRLEGDRHALYFFIIALVSFTAAIQYFCLNSASALLTSKLRTLSFSAILRQEIEFFDKEENNTGSLISALSDNPQRVEGLAGTTLGAVAQSLSTIITGSVLGLVFVWKVALVAIACIPVIISTGYIRLRVVVLKDQNNKKAHESSAQLACEAAASIRTVAALTREGDCCRQYSQSLEEPLRKSNTTAPWSGLLYAFSQSSSFFVIALAFWYGSILVSRRETSPFHFFVVLMSTTFGAMHAGNIFSFVPDVVSAKSAGSDIIKLIDSAPEIDPKSQGKKTVDISKLKGHIRLENIHFRYPARPAVRILRGISLDIQPGTYIALVGASGCGKSTIIQLVERFYDPLAGEIFLDGERIEELNVQQLRQGISLVSQEPTLYAGTIRFNIMLGAIKPPSEVTQEELEKACRDANILDFIKSLPDDFETEVGSKGSQLSGGQKQRIAIARALIRNPKVLLLDEATSALDSSSEKVVQEALDRAAKGRTTIAIAHRLSTIQNADKIYFLKDGVVSESGTHDELLHQRGDYYEYVRLQTLNESSMAGI